MKILPSLLTICGMAAASAAYGQNAAQDFTEKEILFSLQYQSGMQTLCQQKHDTARAVVIEYYDNQNIMRDNGGKDFFVTFNRLQLFPDTQAMTFTPETPVGFNHRTGELTGLEAPDRAMWWDDKTLLKSAAGIFITEADKLCRDRSFGAIPVGDTTYFRRIPTDQVGRLAKVAAEIKMALGY
jgi:hypothetical protein